MGDYTGIRGIIKLKPNKVEGIKHMIETDWGTEHWTQWDHVLSANNKFRFDTRATTVLYGSLCYMPVSWGEFGQLYVKDNFLVLCSSLKDYTGTIQNFVDNCLPEIADEWYLEKLFEYEIEPTIYERYV